MKRHCVLWSWLLLVGCGSVASMPAAAAQTPTETMLEAGRGNGDAAAMLAYFASVQKLPAADFPKEYERVKQRFANQASDSSRLQLVLLLGLPQSAYRDDARALSLLEPLLQQSSQLGNFAALLYAHLAEQKRLGDATQALDIKIKEEQTRSEALQQKLDALINLEKNLLEREAAKK